MVDSFGIGRCESSNTGIAAASYEMGTDVWICTISINSFASVVADDIGIKTSFSSGAWFSYTRACIEILLLNKVSLVHKDGLGTCRLVISYTDVGTMEMGKSEDGNAIVQWRIIPSACNVNTCWWLLLLVLALLVVSVQEQIAATGIYGFRSFSGTVTVAPDIPALVLVPPSKYSAPFEKKELMTDKDDEGCCCCCCIVIMCCTHLAMDHTSIVSSGKCTASKYGWYAMITISLVQKDIMSLVIRWL